MGAIKGVIDLTNTTNPDMFFRYCSDLLNQIVGTINGGIEINQQNMNLSVIDATFTVANSDTTFTHTLDRTPKYYIVCKRSVSCTVYTGTKAFTSSTITLKSSATANVSLIIF